MNLLGLSALLMPVVIFFKANLFGFEFGIHYFPFALFFVSCVASFLGRLNLKSFFTYKLFCAWFFLFILIIFPPLINPGPTAFWVSIFFFFFLCGSLGSDKVGWHKSYFYKLIVFLLFFVGFVQFVYNLPLFDPEIAGGDLYFSDDQGNYRLTSTFLNPNAFAYWIVLSLLSFLSLWHSGLMRKMGFLYIAAALFLLYKSGSRSGWLAVGVILYLSFFYYFLRTKIVYFSAILIFLAYCAVVVIILLPELFLESDVRVEKWGGGLSLFQADTSSLLFGVPSSIDLVWNGVSFSDNIFLLVLYRFGILYFFVFFLFFTYIQFSLLRDVASDSRDWNIFFQKIVPFAMTPMLLFSDFFMFFPVSLMYAYVIGGTSRSIFLSHR